jgi:hypothetical protein
MESGTAVASSLPARCARGGRAGRARPGRPDVALRRPAFMAALLAPLAACTPAPPEGNTAGLVGDDTAADATDTAGPELAGPRGLLVAQS